MCIAGRFLAPKQLQPLRKLHRIRFHYHGKQSLDGIVISLTDLHATLVSTLDPSGDFILQMDAFGTRIVRLQTLLLFSVRSCLGCGFPAFAWFTFLLSNIQPKGYGLPLLEKRPLVQVHICPPAPQFPFGCGFCQGCCRHVMTPTSASRAQIQQTSLALHFLLDL